MFSFQNLILAASTPVTRPILISVDASQADSDLPPIARWFGADEPNYAYFPDGEFLLSELGQLGPYPTYFRTHNLLTTCVPVSNVDTRLKWGCTDAYTEDAEGNPVYNWTVVDRIFDAYLTNDVKPYVQIGFMPQVLATDSEPYTFFFNATSAYNVIYTGWSHVPKSWQKWGELVYQWVKHEVDLRGNEEVNSWYWEVWNEPNIPYWNGTEYEYFALYDYAVANVMKALPTARVGGPEVAGGSGGDWLRLFLDHTLNGKNNATGETGSPIDFISFHAKGSPTYLNATHSNKGHLQMNVSASLQDVRDAFLVISSYPSYANKPVIIGEEDPDGCAACVSAAYGYRNGLIYPSYTAVTFAQIINLAMTFSINLQAVCTWAFEFENHPYFDGFRVLATNRIDKPILNVFRMFGKLNGRRLRSSSTGQYSLERILEGSVREESDVGVLSAFDETGGQISMMIWNYHDDDLPKPDAPVRLSVTGLTELVGQRWRARESVEVKHYRIDNDHSNSYTEWLKMGSPQNPTAEQYARLKAAGMLQTLGPPQRMALEDDKLNLDFSLPIHAVSLIVLKP